MNKYVRKILSKIFSFSLVILIFGSIVGVFFYSLFFTCIISGILYYKKIKENNKTNVVCINKINNNLNNNYIKEVYPIRHNGKNKIKIKKRIRF